ncbi:MAG: hypothetical protein IPI55_15855 [Flavobacteriales bacterium]|nr:hypothetical protein [Flavobacteriales bacterium]
MDSWFLWSEVSKWLFVCSYWVVFIAAWKNSFRHAQWNRLVFWLGGAFAIGCLAWAVVVISMLSDPPMTIGGKTNTTLYHNIPVFGWALIPFSWLYALYSIRKVKRSNTLTPS